MEAINSYPAKNVNPFFHNEEYVIFLIKNIQKKLQRNLLQHEKKIVAKVVREAIPNFYRDKNVNQVMGYFIKRCMTELNKINTCAPEEIDIHELNKSHLGLESDVSATDLKNDASSVTSTAQTVMQSISNVNVQSLLGVSNMDRILSAINPEAVVKYAYIVLDTRYRILDNDGTTFFKWSAVYNDGLLSQGAFNLNDQIRDVIAMKIYPVRIPFVQSVDNDYARVSILIQEFQSQAFITHENSRYHFFLGTNIKDRWINLITEPFNNGYFRFAQPITTISTLTISFGSPNQQIVFDPDRLLFTVSGYGNTAFGNKTQFTSTTAEHNLETGDRVYISGFTTFNPSSDAPIIGQINNSNGNLITTIDTFNFYIDVESLTIYNTGAGTLTATNGSNVIIGTGTTFISTFQINDRINFNGAYYIVSGVGSDTTLTISTPYTGSTGSYSYMRDNRIFGLIVNIYFGSKRIFLPIELMYLKSNK